MKTIDLPGMKATMKRTFYRERFRNEDIDVMIPPPDDREFTQATMTDELIKGAFLSESKARFFAIMGALRARGAEGIVLGYTSDDRR